MLQQKLFLLACICGLLGGASISSIPAQAFLNQEVAQGDGDPVEVSPQEQLEAAKKLADEDVATITAEGDFVVPTYLLQTVEDPEDEAQDLQSEENPVEEQPNALPTPNKTTKVEKTTIKTEYELPVVSIKQTELIPVSEQMKVEKQLTGSTHQTKQAYLNATKRSNPSQQTKVVAKANIPAVKPAMPNTNVNSTKEVLINTSTDEEINNILSGTTTATATPSKKKPLLLPLKSQKTKAKQPTEDENIPQSRLKTFPSVFADKILEAAQTNQELPLIMPMDLKVTFYPNAAEFSGKTIKWLKAFSYKALQDPRYVIEIRLSTTNPQLQEKRLAVVKKILAQSGLSSHQIVVDYVNRPQDSFILRMVKREAASTIVNSKKDKKIINW